jgi:hypothetical protein
MVKINASGSFAQLGYFNGGSLLYNAFANISNGSYNLGNAGGTRMTLDSAGNVGIGTSSPAVKLEVFTGTTGAWHRFEANAVNESLFSNFSLPSGYQGMGLAASTIRFFTGAAGGGSSAERARIDSSGNLLVGTTTPASSGQASSISTGGVFAAQGPLSNHTTSKAILEHSNNVSRIRAYGATGGTGVIAFNTGGGGNSPDAERCRLDSSGNLLVGTTSSNFAVVGSQIGTGGSNYMTRSGAQPLLLNRLSSDGDILLFMKDTTTVGTIASRAGLVTSVILDPRSGGAGLTSGGNTIAATDQTGAITDGATNLGTAAFRWKDLYLSGGVYLGGTGSANLLDDYEEGTYDPSFTPSSGSVTISSSFNTLSYIKIGSLVRIMGLIIFTANTATGSMQMSVPFTSASLPDDSERSLPPLTAVGGTQPSNEFFVEINPSVSGFFLKRLAGTGNSIDNASGEFGAGGQLFFNFTYQAA